MKKLLSILGTALLAISPVSAVVACAKPQDNVPTDDGTKEVQEFLTKATDIINKNFNFGDTKHVIDGDSDFMDGGQVVEDTIDANYTKPGDPPIDKQITDKKTLDKIYEYIDNQLSHSIVPLMQENQDLTPFLNNININDVLRVDRGQSQIVQKPFIWCPLKAEDNGPHASYEDPNLQMFHISGSDKKSAKDVWHDLYLSNYKNGAAFTKLGLIEPKIIIDVTLYNPFNHTFDRSKTIAMQAMSFYVVNSTGLAFFETMMDDMLQGVEDYLRTYTLTYHSKRESTGFADDLGDFWKTGVNITLYGDLEKNLQMTGKDIVFEQYDISADTPVDKNNGNDIGKINVNDDPNYFSKTYFDSGSDNKYLPRFNRSDFIAKYTKDWNKIDQTFTKNINTDLGLWSKKDALIVNKNKPYIWDPSSMTDDLKNQAFNVGTLRISKWKLYDMEMAPIKVPFAINKFDDKSGAAETRDQFRDKFANVLADTFSTGSATNAGVNATRAAFWDNAEINTNEKIWGINYGLMFSVNTLTQDVFNKYAIKGSEKTFINALDMLSENIGNEIVEIQNGKPYAVSAEFAQSAIFYCNFDSIFDYSISKYHNEGGIFNDDGPNEAKHILFGAIAHSFHAYIYIDFAGFNFSLCNKTIEKARIFY